MDPEGQEESQEIVWTIIVQCFKERGSPPVYKVVMNYYGMSLYQYLDVNQSSLNGPRKNNSRFSHSAKYGVAFYDYNQMYINCINCRCTAFDIFDNCMVCDMYREGRWSRYVE